MAGIKARKKDPAKGGYNPSGEERKVWDEYQSRKTALLNSRKGIYGQDLDSMMRRFDYKYFRNQADIPASELDANQRPLAINNAYGKIQTALGTLIDRNPKYILEEDHPKYTKYRNLLRALGEKSFRRTNSLGQLKLSVFNQAKRGWFIGRTFNRRLVYDAKFLTNVDNKGKRAYETRCVTKLDDIQYMNLSNYNAWLDEQTKPDDFWSTRDWMWREVWQIDDLRNLFPEKEFPNMKYVSEGGDTSATYESAYNQIGYASNTGQEAKKHMIELFFYENQYDDKFIIEANGVMIVWEPLPQNHKRLSCTYGYWHLRSDDTPYGIGIIEEMENDEELVDRILNMSMRQLLISIAPMGFYTGSEDLEDENMKVTPGVMRRTMDPRNIAWLPVPPGNQKGLENIQWLESKQEDKTGISELLGGGDANTDTGTAFEASVRREGALKRLRLPLKSIQYALEWEFNNRIGLIQQTYSQFQVEHIVGQDQINDYLDEVKMDPDFFFIENEGEVGKEKFYALKFPTVSLSLEQTEDGEYVEGEKEAFFTIKPEMLAFQGVAIVNIDSLLVASEELEKADTIRLSGILAPLLAGPMEINAKLAKQILQSHNLNPDKWLPQEWIDFLAGKKKEQAPSIPGMGGGSSPDVPLTTNKPGSMPQVPNQPELAV